MMDSYILVKTNPVKHCADIKENFYSFHFEICNNNTLHVFLIKLLILFSLIEREGGGRECVKLN